MSAAAGSTGDVDRDSPGPEPIPLERLRESGAAERSGYRVVGRRDPRDAFLTSEGESTSFSALRPGARVIVAERRAGVLLAAFAPRAECLRSDSVEGALGRLDAGEADAAILPGAAVLEAGRETDIAEWLHQTAWIPAPGRGFLVQRGVESGDGRPDLAAALEAEEAVRVRLEEPFEGSTAVIGAIGIPFGEYLRLWAITVSPEGRRAVRVHRTGRQDRATELAERVARELLDRGGRAILEGNR